MLLRVCAVQMEKASHKKQQARFEPSYPNSLCLIVQVTL